MKTIKTATDYLGMFFGTVFMCITAAFSFFTILFGFVANAFYNNMNIKKTCQEYRRNVIDKICRFIDETRES